MIKKSTEIMKGIGVSKGIAIGKAYVIKKNTAALSGAVVSGGDIIIEIEKFDNAVKRSVEELERTRENKGLGLKEEEVQILEAHIELLMDFGYVDPRPEPGQWFCNNIWWKNFTCGHHC